MPFDDSVLAVDGDTWEIAHMLVGTCQLVEKCRLATILLPGKGEGQLSALG